MIHRPVILINLILIMLISFSGCSPMPVKVLTDNNFETQNYKAYDIVPNEQVDLVNLELDKNTIDKIVTETIDKQMKAKGYKKSTDNPDILISYYLVTNAKTDVFVLNQYYSNLGYQLPPGRSSTRDSLKFGEVTYEEGILIIDIIDAQSKERVWQAYLTSRTDVYKKEERKERRIKNSVVKVLTPLPSVY